MTPPTDPAALAAHQRAGLAALDAALRFAMRAAVLSYPALHRVQRPNEPPEIATARDFVEQCELVLAALDAHRYALVTGLPALGACSHDDDDHDIPF